MIEIERNEKPQREGKWWWELRKIELEDLPEGPVDVDWGPGGIAHAFVWRDEWVKVQAEDAERLEWYRAHPNRGNEDDRRPYTVARWIALGAYSREPLLDACRELRRMGVAPARPVALFRPGRSDWDLRTMVAYGASRTVSDPSKGGRPRFVTFKPHPRAS